MRHDPYPSAESYDYMRAAVEGLSCVLDALGPALRAKFFEGLRALYCLSCGDQLRGRTRCPCEDES